MTFIVGTWLASLTKPLKRSLSASLGARGLHDVIRGRDREDRIRNKSLGAGRLRAYLTHSALRY